MADRMIVMHAGVAEQIGTPLEVYEKPQTLFAAQFIGSPAMNVFNAKVEDGHVWLGGSRVARTTGARRAGQAGVFVPSIWCARRMGH